LARQEAKAFSFHFKALQGAALILRRALPGKSLKMPETSRVDPVDSLLFTGAARGPDIAPEARCPYVPRQLTAAGL
jgi:hypothetical protein